MYIVYIDAKFSVMFHFCYKNTKMFPARHDKLFSPALEGYGLLVGETDGVWTITTYLEKGPERHDIGIPVAVDQSQTADVTAVHDSDDLLKVRNFSVTSSHFAHLKPFYAFCPARYPVENAIWRLNPPV